MYDICCIGHITLDKVITPRSVINMAGGTSFYFSNAIRNLDVSYLLVTAVAPDELYLVSDLQHKGINVKVLPSAHTVYFENSYTGNMDHRVQRVLQKADPFRIDRLNDINARIYHLGPLLADDIPVEVIRTLAAKGTVSLDVQGYLREVRGNKVHPVDWPAKKEALQYVTILKADDTELAVLTGQKNVHDATMALNDWGVKEVVITFASRGSLIYSGGIFYKVPAYFPATEIVDTTGCGDTYMAGYLYQRTKNASLQDSGEFAAAMAGLKTASSGPFNGIKEDVVGLLENNKRKIE